MQSFNPTNVNYPAFPAAFQNYPGFQDFQGGYTAFPDNQECPGNFPISPAFEDFSAKFPDTNMPFDYSPVAGRYCNEALTRIIQECQATCEYLTTHLKGCGDCRSRRNQLIVLRDCADICGLNAKFVPRGSDFDRRTAALCARICECCAQECLRFNDRLSQQAAQVCLECAKACRAFAGR